MMKSVGVITRETITSEIKDSFSNSQACYFLSFNKVKAVVLNNVRGQLHNLGSRIFVAKNSLVKKAFLDIGWDDLNDFVTGETGIVFVYDQDVVETCKKLVAFSKENETLELKGGILKNKRITSKELIELSKLPAREILLGTAVGALASPITGFMTVLNQIVLKFLWTLEEIKKTKKS
ncbi:MAG: 50S ribosomal protein L10 [Candidatus Omnitrophica bacterium]|nr:50S ribosomal protein L10 [Candidatus Omnitrophota bacterium]